MALEHPALTDLRALASRKDLEIADDQQWRIGSVDPATASLAAVLVLFGVLDDAPASDSLPSAVTEVVGADLDVLIVVRASTLRQHAGQPAFPGGKIDPEDYTHALEKGVPVEHVAALREAVEETGLDAHGVKILGSLNTLPLAVSNFMVTPVLAWWDSVSEVKAQDHNESSLVLRIPVADLLNPESRHTATVTRGNATHKSPAFTVASADASHEEFVIWGFTGILLDQVFNGLGWTIPWNSEDQRQAPGT